MQLHHWNMLKERGCVFATDIVTFNLPNFVTDLKLKAVLISKISWWMKVFGLSALSQCLCYSNDPNSCQRKKKQITHIMIEPLNHKHWDSKCNYYHNNFTKQCGVAFNIVNC